VSRIENKDLMGGEIQWVSTCPTGHWEGMGNTGTMGPEVKEKRERTLSPSLDIDRNGTNSVFKEGPVKIRCPDRHDIDAEWPLIRKGEKCIYADPGKSEGCV